MSDLLATLLRLEPDLVGLLARAAAMRGYCSSTGGSRIAARGLDGDVRWLAGPDRRPCGSPELRTIEAMECVREAVLGILEGRALPPEVAAASPAAE